MIPIVMDEMSDPGSASGALDPALTPEMLSVDQAQAMAEFFGVLADPNRLRILSVLARQETCVQDLAQLTKMSESAVSHQLRTLRTSRLVRYRKRGRKVFYSLKDQHIQMVYQAVAEHLEETDE